MTRAGWELVTPRVARRRGAPETDLQRVMAGVLDTGPSSYVSHTSRGRPLGSSRVRPLPAAGHRRPGRSAVPVGPGNDPSTTPSARSVLNGARRHPGRASSAHGPRAVRHRSSAASRASARCRLDASSLLRCLPPSRAGDAPRAGTHGHDLDARAAGSARRRLRPTVQLPGGAVRVSARPAGVATASSTDRLGGRHGLVWPRRLPRIATCPSSSRSTRSASTRRSWTRRPTRPAKRHCAAPGSSSFDSRSIRSGIVRKTSSRSSPTVDVGPVAFSPPDRSGLGSGCRADRSQPSSGLIRSGLGSGCWDDRIPAQILGSRATAPFSAAGWRGRRGRGPRTAVTRWPVATCRNSLGPWAFEPGPSTPVIRNWAAGKRWPSMPMNGIVPPSPSARAGAPKAARRRRPPMRVASHGAVGGASQPASRLDTVERDVRAVGRVGGRASRRARPAARRRRRSGGRRNDSASVGHGRRTLPAVADRRKPVGADDRERGLARSGPSSCVDRVGRAIGPRCAPRRTGQARPSGSPSVDGGGGRAPRLHGRLGGDVDVGARAPDARRCRCPRSGRGAGAGRGSDDGTTPPASPECTPSVSTRPRRRPPTRPRSEVVIHSRS